MRPRLEALLPRRQSLAKEQADVGHEIRRLVSSSSTKGDGSTKSDKERDGEQLRRAQARARALKDDATSVAAEIEALNATSLRLRLKLPNTTHDDVPRGGESEARIVAVGGQPSLLADGPLRKAFDALRLPVTLSQAGLDGVASADPARDHVALLDEAGSQLLDTHASQLASGGSNWPYMRASLAKLEHALVQYALTAAVSQHGFSPCVVPDVVKRDILARTGFAPRDGGGGQVYWLTVDGDERPSAEEKDTDLCLAATAEIPLAGLCAGQLLENLEGHPRKLVAASHAFRAEAGARGADSRGLYRVHQFTKVELFVVCAGAESHAMLDALRGIQEHLVGQLGLPYRVLDMPTEELGASAHRKYDVEVWMPGRGRWGEVSSASNCTDYQARRLYLRHRSAASDGEAYAHTLNATAVAVPRLLVALVENSGVASDGRLRLPDVLRPFWLAPAPTAPADVEWLSSTSSSSSSHPSLARAIDAVRALAQRQGTDAPTMVLAFLILHELTAILPLFVLFWLFATFGLGGAVVAWFLDASHGQVQPTESPAGSVAAWRRWCGEWLSEGAARVERYGRRKGYFGFAAPGASDDDEAAALKTGTVLAGSFANAVAAYAVVKALLPLRLAASVALAGPLARRCIEPLKRALLRLSRARSTKVP
ncbi:seryl-tRNA synthetase [Acaromyces ingoldii]|uniref:serine--tRNA ligase n=1 Tax=Acaromyces ingoldii TaxID=215250 RepID=A0A316YKH9_9BASI|nr:seryl-tRNA synthetase [Acaromyces ingoldii]PWN89692.1 seryl-tRNA synthetase [Acaromyces ingoldii]